MSLPLNFCLNGTSMFSLTNVSLLHWSKSCSKWWLKGSSMWTSIMYTNSVNFNRIYIVEYENSELKCLTNTGKIFKTSISSSWPFGKSKHKSLYSSLFKRLKGVGSYFLSTEYIYKVTLIRKQKHLYTPSDIPCCLFLSVEQ